MLAPGTSQGSSESVASTTPEEDEDEPQQIPNDSQVAPSIHHFNTAEDEQGKMVEVNSKHKEPLVEVVVEEVPPTPPVETSKAEETPEVVETTVPTTPPLETSKAEETQEVVETTVPPTPVETSKAEETPEVVAEPVPPEPPSSFKDLEETEETPGIRKPCKRCEG